MEDEEVVEKEEKKKKLPIIPIVIIAVLAIVISSVATIFVMSKMSKDDSKEESTEQVEVVEGEKEEETQEEEEEIIETKEENLEDVEEENLSEEMASGNIVAIDPIDVSNNFIHPVSGKKLSKVEENRFTEGYLLEENINNRVFVFLDNFVVENVQEYEPGKIKVNISKVGNRKGEDILSLPVVFDFDYYSIMDQIEEGKAIELSGLSLEVRDLEEIGRTGYLVKYNK